VILASPAFRRRIGRAISGILSLKRAPSTLARHMIEFREKYAEEFATADPLEVRHTRGGLLDADYIAIFHLLRLGHRRPKIFNPDFDAALASLVAARALAKEDGAALARGRRVLAQTYGLLRLCCPERKAGEALPEALSHLLAEAAGVRAGALEAKLRETEAAISALYQRTFARYAKAGGKKP